MTENNNNDNWNQEIGSRLLELRKHYGDFRGQAREIFRDRQDTILRVLRDPGGLNIKNRIPVGFLPGLQFLSCYGI